MVQYFYKSNKINFIVSDFYIKGVLHKQNNIFFWENYLTSLQRVKQKLYNKRNLMNKVQKPCKVQSHETNPMLFHMHERL